MPYIIPHRFPVVGWFAVAQHRPGEDVIRYRYAGHYRAGMRMVVTSRSRIQAFTEPTNESSRFAAVADFGSGRIDGDFRADGRAP
jgi:hypothetical protein